MAQSVRKSRRNDRRGAIGTVPSSNAQRLLSTTIPLASDNAEEGETSGFEEAEEKSTQQLTTLPFFSTRPKHIPRSHQAPKIMTSCHRRLRSTPAKAQHRHQYPMRHLHNQNRRERLPCELRNRRD